jgi:integrase
MARPKRGGIYPYVGKDGLIYRSLRFTDQLGERQRVKLGPVSVAEAERALSQTIADVERGIWKPESKATRIAVPRFKAFAQEWSDLNMRRLATSTQADYTWRLEVHLIPSFEDTPLDEITFARIEEYRAAKEAEDDPLSPRSINMTITLLGAILERAVKRKLIESNPARDRDLRAPERAPTRSYLDAAGQITALLDAAGELDRKAASHRRHVERRAMIATLIFAGLRIGELFALRWRDVDLAGGWLSIADAKTDAGVRKVKMRAALRDELLSLRGRRQDTPQSAYVFGTSKGGHMSADNFRARVLGKPASVKAGAEQEGDDEKAKGTGAVGLANEQLEVAGLPPLPDKLTPHSLRRTFCSLLYALGEDPGTVMDEMGHTDPMLALRVYRQAMRRGEDEKAQLRALVEGGIEPGFRPTTGQRAELEAETTLAEATS